MNSYSPRSFPIMLLRNHPEALSAAATWFSEKWGIPTEAYQESMEECLANPSSAVPQWYFLQNEQQDIIAGCGIIENDFHDRKDLAPNLCALYVEGKYRRQGIAGRLLAFVCRDMARLGLSALYLVTDHTSFYERYGWTFAAMVTGDDGCMTRLYKRQLSEFLPPVSKVLVFGSLNIDHVYQVEHIAAPGETIASKKLQILCGGKGLNQAIAFSKAGANTYLAGKIGPDGGILKEACQQYGVKTDFLLSSDLPSGHAIIQVDQEGQNSILLFGGANQAQSRAEIDRILQNFDAGDRLVLQNEINELPYIIESAAAKGMELILNPSPYHPDLQNCGLGKLSWLILNEVEAFQMTGETELTAILARLKQYCPNAGIVLTLGEEGTVCYQKGKLYKQACFPADVLDTTAAGDTFTGYFFTELLLSKKEFPKEIPLTEELSCEELPLEVDSLEVNSMEVDKAAIEAALYTASKAASITVSRNGAADSIPTRQELFTG